MAKGGGLTCVSLSHTHQTLQFTPKAMARDDGVVLFEDKDAVNSFAINLVCVCVLRVYVRACVCACACGHSAGLALPNPIV